MNDNIAHQVVRICPLCGKHNPLDESFCACGTMLADVDFTHLGTQTQAIDPGKLVHPEAIDTRLICPHADCAQPNPAGTERCLYCNRLIREPAGELIDESQAVLPPALRVRFKVLEVLPTGGAQADLVLAETAQHEPRMLKLYRKGIKPDRQVLERLPSVASEHLIRFYDHGEADGVAYEVMEYCPEGNLRHLLESGPQSNESLRRLIEQLSSTLGALHAQQILHRDLKPENILLRSSHPLKIALTDFGASSLKMATQYFTNGARTAHYAAPEVLTGVLDEKSDWWSLGMIVLEAVSGRHPYAELSEQVALHQLATQSVEVKGVFDESLRMLCRGLLLRNPKKRWSSSEVARWLAGDESLTMPEDAGAGVVVKPYTLGRSQCTSKTDLALALTRYWEEGKKDLIRGIVLNWVEQELRDFNLARDINDVMMRRDLSDDARLLRVIVRALPGIPPIWKGKVITQEALVRAATQAVNENKESLEWLLSIYKQDILDVFGDNNAAMANISRDWKQGVDAYRQLWERAKVLEEEWRRRPRAHASEVADIDYLMYLAPIRMNVPSLNKLLPDLVLSLYFPAFTASAKKTVLNARETTASDCGWYTRLAEESTDKSTLFWSVMQRLLPYAIEDATKEQRVRQQVVKNTDKAAETVIFEIDKHCKKLLSFEDTTELDAWNTQQLSSALSEWIGFIAWLRGLDHDHAALRAQQAGLETVTHRVTNLHGFLDGHSRILDINAIWLKPSRLAVLAGIISMVWAFSPLLGVPLLLLAGAGLLWRRQLAQRSQREGLRRMGLMLESLQQFR